MDNYYLSFSAPNRWVARLPLGKALASFAQGGTHHFRPHPGWYVSTTPGLIAMACRGLFAETARPVGLTERAAFIDGQAYGS
jgi:hypothetical protein